MNKTDIRNHFIEIRDDLAAVDVRKKSELIQNQIETLIDWNGLSSIHAYTSVKKWNEVDTGWLRQFILENYPNIALTYSNPDRSSAVPTMQYDLIIIPMLAFDLRFQRIGFGGGWYDRFLMNQTSAVKLGIAYDVQQYEELPTEAHDVSLDVIVTESRVMKINDTPDC